MRLKVCVLADGTIQVEGQPATIDELDAALSRAKAANGQVWYYRETAKGERSGLDEYFATVRRTAAGKGEGEGLVIVKPDRTLMVVPRLAETAELKKMAESMSKMVPTTVQRNIAAIAFTVFESGPQGIAGLAEVGKAIPFLGMLVGFSYIGHAVWVFEGHASALAAGCRDADLLLVDSAMRPFLARGWEKQAEAAMRNANILVHNRANFTLAALRKVGADPSRIEFRD